ncbi:hypothetical protein E2C01_063010 [Portunus trituberculatus]|uniref:Secreted protein n=1 Tax=Portunus trituberculatus TaxID=210409 RepID=A0A5B7H9D5_PORTR|nr:hypothetical protein [Portunus trituberculatus]
MRLGVTPHLCLILLLPQGSYRWALLQTLRECGSQRVTPRRDVREDGKVKQSKPKIMPSSRDTKTLRLAGTKVTTSYCPAESPFA